MRYVIGADAGTTCFKAGLYDEKMRQVAAASEEYTLLYSAEGYVELPAERYWEIFCKMCIRDRASTTQDKKWGR